jgi:para-nitrobenzyl esterase
MLDIIAALERVQENIAAFGGDPDRVTIAGESAGAMALGTLKPTPRAATLCHRAICQSGAASNGISAPTASKIAGHMLEGLVINAGDTDALTAVPSQVVIDTQMALGNELNETRNARSLAKQRRRQWPSNPRMEPTGFHSSRSTQSLRATGLARR